MRFLALGHDVREGANSSTRQTRFLLEMEPHLFRFPWRDDYSVMRAGRKKVDKDFFLHTPWLYLTGTVTETRSIATRVGNITRPASYRCVPHVANIWCRPKRPVKGAILVAPPFPNISVRGNLCNHVRREAKQFGLGTDGWKLPDALAAEIYRAISETPANDHYDIRPAPGALKYIEKYGLGELEYTTAHPLSLTELLRQKTTAEDWPAFLDWWEKQTPQQVANWVKLVPDVHPTLQTTLDELLDKNFARMDYKQVKLFKLS